MEDATKTNEFAQESAGVSAEAEIAPSTGRIAEEKVAKKDLTQDPDFKAWQSKVDQQLRQEKEAREAAEARAYYLEQTLTTQQMQSLEAMDPYDRAVAETQIWKERAANAEAQARAVGVNQARREAVEAAVTEYGLPRELADKAGSQLELDKIVISFLKEQASAAKKNEELEAQKATGVHRVLPPGGRTKPVNTNAFMNNYLRKMAGVG